MTNILKTMRKRTVVIVGSLLVTAFVFGVFAFSHGNVSTGTSNEAFNDGTLKEYWVSDTARHNQVNHHAITTVTIPDGVLVIAPLNELGDTADLTATSCALTALKGVDGTIRWEAGIAPEYCDNHAIGDPAVADIDQDGTPEVLVATDAHALYVYDALTGEERWRYTDLESLGYSSPVVADLTPASGLDIVVVDLGGSIVVLRPDGTTVWTRTLESTWAAPLIADFDEDGEPELAVGTGKRIVLLDGTGSIEWQTDISVLWAAAGQPNADDSAINIFVASDIDRTMAVIEGQTGQIVWQRPLDGVPAVHTVADGEGDGNAEVYVGVSGGTIHALDARNGSIIWTTSVGTSDARITPPPVLGDVSGDGSPELVAVTSDGVVSVLDPTTGELRASYERDVGIWIHPTLADLDGDGAAEILVMYGDGRVVALSFQA